MCFTKAKESDCFVGIDVSKETLDLHLLPQGKSWKVPNGEFEALCEKLKPYRPRLIVLEPTGGYELGVMRAFRQAGLPVKRAHALHIHHHTKGSGQWAKTDGLDARAIADYAKVYAEKLQPIELSEELLELQQLSNRRQQLIQMQTAERNREQGPAMSQQLQASCQRVLEVLKEEISEMEEQLRARIESQTALQEKKRLLMSMSGVGEIVAHRLLAALPELGQVNRKTIAALAGVCPYERASGNWKGESHIWGGRSEVRSALYMATLSAIKHNSSIKPFYEKLRQQGKKFKVAMVACMHKILRMLNAMLAKGESFQP